MSEIPTCYGCEHRKARKSHVCCECDGVIQRDETYHYHSGVWDGVGASFKVCEECEELRDVIDSRCTYVDELVPFGELSESVLRWPEYQAAFAAIRRNRRR